MVPSNPWVGPSQRTKVSLLSTCTDELLSTPKIAAFLPGSKAGYEKSERESNLIPYLE